MYKKINIAPSILSANFARLGDELKELTNAGADSIHIDVMDGHYVPNISLGPKIVKDIRKYSDLPFSVHLMIKPVDEYIKRFVNAGSDVIIVHPDSEIHIHRTLQYIKSLGKGAGIALNPLTSLSVLDYSLDLVDVILIMTVNPGYGGQEFIESQLEKIRLVRKIIDKSGLDISLEVDGGVNLKTAPGIISVGADSLVSGTAIFGHDHKNYKEKIDSLRQVRC